MMGLSPKRWAEKGAEQVGMEKGTCALHPTSLLQEEILIDRPLFD